MTATKEWTPTKKEIAARYAAFQAAYAFSCDSIEGPLDYTTHTREGLKAIGAVCRAIFEEMAPGKDRAQTMWVLNICTIGNAPLQAASTSADPLTFAMRLVEVSLAAFDAAVAGIAPHPVATARTSR